MNDIIKKTDLELKDDVLDKLKYAPIIKAIDISVLFKNGKVTIK